MTQDPRRLRDDPAAPDLARALREAQGDVLSPEAVARVRAGLTVAGVLAAGGASAGAPGAALRSPTAKLLAIAARLGIGLAGLGLAGLVGVTAMRHASSQPSAPPDQAIPPATPVPAPAEVPASPPLDALPAPAPAATVVETSRARASATQRPAGAIPSPREGALLLEARRALGTDPARALALVHAHEREFPESQLGHERARIAAEARQRLENGGNP